MLRSEERGSVLLITVILLAVLAAIGGAAVVLSSRGRISAGAQIGYDALVECANAAQAKLWAEIGVHGHAYYQAPNASMTVETITIADGSVLASPAHIDTTVGSPVSSAIVAGLAAGTSDGLGTDQDSTNSLSSSVKRGPGSGGDATLVTARCRDTAGRMHEVEFSFRFSL